MISGGTALLDGIQELLTAELAIYTVIADPFVHMGLSANLDPNKLQLVAPQLMVASGLALRSFEPWHI